MSLWIEAHYTCDECGKTEAVQHDGRAPAGWHRLEGGTRHTCSDDCNDKWAKRMQRWADVLTKADEKPR